MCILLFALNASAGTNSYFHAEIWPHLSLTKDIEPFEKALEQLKVYATTSSNRVELIEFIRRGLASPDLDKEEQAKLGLVVRSLQHSSYTNDIPTIRELLKGSARFAVFYAESLMEMSPGYIDLSFDVFTNRNDVISYRTDFEFGKMSSFILQDELLICLKRRTKKDFGKDREAWLNWWKTEGRFCSYNLDTGEYNPRDGAAKSQALSPGAQGSGVRP
jgi:hypothetical protein